MGGWKMSPVASFPWHQETSYKTNRGMKWGNWLGQSSFLPLWFSTCVNIMPLIGRFKFFKKVADTEKKDHVFQYWSKSSYVHIFCPEEEWKKSKQFIPRHLFVRHLFFTKKCLLKKEIGRDTWITKISSQLHKRCLLQSIPWTAPSSHAMPL